MLAYCTLALGSAPKHRNHLDQIAPVAADTSAVEAYSDTTAHTGWTLELDDDDDDDFIDVANHMDDMMEHTLGIGGGMLALLIVGCVIFVLLLPVIIVILILRYMVRRHNARVTLAEQALAAGQPVPEELRPADKHSNDYLWRRGIRNISVGVGLAIMFMLCHSGLLTGIAILVICYGVGQLVIVRTTGGRYNNSANEGTDVEK